MIAAIVDDSAAKYENIRMVLVTSGAFTMQDVLHAENVVDAKALLSERLIDLLVVDCVLPRSAGEPPDPDAGIEFLRDLVDDPPAHTPSQIIGLTAFDSIADQLEAEFLAYSVPLLSYSESGDGWSSALRYAALRAARSAPSRDSLPTEPSLIAIVCALGEEMDAVLDTPGGWSNWENGDQSSVYWRGELALGDDTTKMVAVLSPRMGPCSCAITSTKLIELCRPKFLATVGIMAGIRGKVDIGDVILAEQCWDWSEGKWTTEHNEPVFLPSPHVLSAEPEILSAARSVARDTSALLEIWASWRGKKPKSPPKLHLGPVASSSAVVAAQSVTARIRAAHRKLLGIEMEAYALHAAALDAKVPRPMALAVKGVSDFADHKKNDDWRAYASYTSVAVFTLIMREVLRKSG